LAEVRAGSPRASHWRIVADRESGRTTYLCPRHAADWDKAAQARRNLQPVPTYPQDSGHLHNLRTFKTIDGINIKCIDCGYVENLERAWDEWVRYQARSGIPPEPPLGLSSD
jgi:hypothetical protein